MSTIEIGACVWIAGVAEEEPPPPPPPSPKGKRVKVVGEAVATVHLYGEFGAKRSK